MHDIVRDVAIWIASQEEHGFVVKAGSQLKEWPKMENLKRCKQLSLMQNEISKLPEQMSCSQLITLSLRDNRCLTEILDGCFEGMISLKVLDLRNTNSVSIPLSFSRLTELQVLHLNVDSSFLWERERFDASLDLSLLGNMKKLEILDLSGSHISTLPLEIGGLTNLKSLHLSRTSKLIIPPEVLSKLSCLEELNLFRSFDEWKVEGSEDSSSKACLSEVASLAGLTKLKLGVSNRECLSSTISLSWKNLTQFLIILRGSQFEQPNVIFQDHYAAQMGFFNLIISKLSSWDIVLLEQTEELHLCNCGGPKNIYPQLSGGSGLNKLRSFKLERCGGLEHILIAELEGIPILAFNRLEELKLKEMGNLRKICHGPFLKGSLENLKILGIESCHNLEHIFQMSMAQGLPHLEEVKILCCNELEEIFMKNEGEDEEGKVVLPRLRVLELISLPNLSAVCRGIPSLHDFPAFERLCIYECDNLKSFPMSLSLESTPKLKKIKVEEEWFNQLEWDETTSEKMQLQEWVTKPGRAEADFGRFNVKTVVRSIYNLLSGSELPIAAEDLEIMDLVDPSSPLPTWFTEEDLAVYTSLYEKSGFCTPLQVPCRTLHEELTDARVQVPALLIMGEKDYYIRSGKVKDYVPDLETTFMPKKHILFRSNFQTR